MHRNQTANREWLKAFPYGLMVAVLLASFAVAGEGRQAALGSASSGPRVSRTGLHEPPLEGDEIGRKEIDLQTAKQYVGTLVLSALNWYRSTPAGERVSAGGLAACAALGLVILLERLARLRRRGIIPPDFTARFVDRLHEGKLDGGKALDYCEMNPSPAARVALAAVRRWGRPPADLERAVAMAHRVEVERLRRNVGTFRRIAVLAPLLGLLGSLLATERVLAAMSGPTALADSAALSSTSSIGSSLAAAINPLTLGVALATLAIVVYDTLSIRIERLSGALDRLGAETIDAIAMSTPIPSPAVPLMGVAQPRSFETHSGHYRMASSSDPGRTPHQRSVHRPRAEEPQYRKTTGDHDIGF
jgi:biopolymer transport protein ExbB